ncbi:MAG: PhoH family protein [Planctomycetota bacterium]|nr:MAG: PhoH family protein [Planctomycetota bacterium]
MDRRIPLLSLEEQRQLFGPYDRHVKRVSQRYGVRLSAREGTLRISGPEESVELLAQRVGRVLGRIRSGPEPSPDEVEQQLLGGEEAEPAALRAPAEVRQWQRDLPTARTEAQQLYLDALVSSDLTIASGPAGTGKTYLAVAAAVRQLREGRVQRLVLTRPAVEAGEHLGFLPGDFEAKVNPYLRPLYDALHDILGPASARRLRDMEVVEIAPLAFMRGRTLNHSFIILDEAQNATVTQFKMFLTRLGEASRAVVTGDRTQTDLPDGRSGLEDALRRLQGVEGVAMIEFSAADIQRSPLVRRIVRAYGDES